ncbi:ABC transporter ATPase [Pedobacter glucosidilyticus]|uniref:ABC transporter ATPase n=1 Tax=Pedobacter glucosidilyticus TaxID=1122941 RepID=UPI0026EA408D|nr:ABC transporter ATPase [Pedobacter glucosidilyticus]
MKFHPLSRVWIYQSDRVFTDAEVKELEQLLADFTAGWQAHQQQLKAGFEIKYNRFIVLIVDEREAGASGCSIDKSVHLMKEIQEKYQVNLFDRFNIAYKEQEEVKTVNRDAFEALIAVGKINQNTIVFNNLVQNYQEYQDKWEGKFINSWHQRVFSLPQSI